ncbi:peptidoglycan-binding domain-containing protein [Sulfoacidibacillus thermotolerans]|uniref:Peptidoglycan binding-like domain-containing protein n=1 Tax=Sulfoacidibacillus thermotolerans TaxID=1765684 RepID=A0A2U3DCG8_SULT2|nr:peptidoglycan-binding domain-containing protein [Sulfoacidibacillus thermotolerans]PWI58968.1 hypothetical protein BM613_02535 [Sulfoacidibacillus thermotolerans]
MLWRGKNVNAEPDYEYHELGFQDYGHAVGFLQYMLRRLGFYHGPVTEHFNQGTEEALKRFQMSQHVPITGRMDQQMWKLLIGVAVNRQILQNEVGPQFVNHFTVAQMG